MKFTQFVVILFFVLFQVSLLNAQESKANKNISQTTENQWIKDIEHDGDLKNYFTNNFSTFGLASEKDMQFVKSFSTKNGWSHHRFQQHYKGLEVVNGVYILHEKNGLLKKGNGNIFPNIDLPIKPTLSKKEIVNRAESHALNQVLNENDGQIPEGFSQNTLHTEDVELVIADKNFPNKSGIYRLAYRLVVGYDALPPQHDEYLIDAQNGNIISIIPQVCEINVDGVANTKYYGEQTITVDSISENEYLLEDYTRAEEGIITNDNRNGNQPFKDEDNYWNNVNEWQDEIAGDAHYCAISYYDYMKEKFNFNSMDNEGIAMISNIHVSSTRSYVNAYWNGRNTNYGDGDCLEYGPLTTLDVVAHEFTHGMTEFSSGLIYRGESGGLNEAMSDIFGKAVEYQYDQDNFTWEIGRKFIKSPDAEPFRDMSNPNEYGDPNHYKGKNWSFSGAVHTNSGVLNYWFYLLVEGKLATNEKGVDYDVKAIGWNKAMDIVFAIQTGYLVPDSDYFHAFESSLQATEDLFGKNSDEYSSVVEAWKAVGLWKPEPYTLERDFSIELINVDSLYCGVDSAEFELSVKINNHTNTIFPAGTAIELGHLFFIYRGFSRTDAVLETFYLDTDLGKDESKIFTFSEPVNFEGAGTYDDQVVAFIGSGTNDLFPFNDTTTQKVVVTPSVGQDLSISAFNSSVRCTNTGVRFNMSLTNDGCETIPQGTPYEITLDVNGVAQTNSYELDRDLEADQSTSQSITIDIPDFMGEKNIEYFASVSFANDSNPENDNSSLRTLRLFDNIELGYFQDFTDFDPQTDPIINVGSSSGCLYDMVEYQESTMLGYSGDEAPRTMEEGCDQIFKVVNDNRRFQGTTSFCINASGVENATLSFDLTQFIKENNFIIAPEHTSILKVTGPGVDEQYLFGQDEGETVKHYLSLPVDFFDKITFTTFTITGDEDAIANSNFDVGDYILIDNINFTDGTVNTDEQTVASDFNVFPNPTSDVIYFENNSPFSSQYNIEIYNTLGAQVYTQNGLSGRAAVQTENFATGLYFYKIVKNQELIKAGRLVVEKE